MTARLPVGSLWDQRASDLGHSPAWGSETITPSPEGLLPLGSRRSCLCPCEASAASCKEKAEQTCIQLQVLTEDFLCSAPPRPPTSILLKQHTPMRPKAPCPSLEWTLKSCFRRVAGAPLNHSLKFGSKRLLGTSSRRSGWAAGSLAGSAESTEMEKPCVRALSHSPASARVVFVFYSDIPAGRGLSRWQQQWCVPVRHTQGVRNPGHRRCGLQALCQATQTLRGVVALRERGGHCSVKSSSKPAVEAAAAKTQKGGLGSGVSSAPSPNTAGPWRPHGHPGDGRHQQPLWQNGSSLSISELVCSPGLGWVTS